MLLMHGRLKVVLQVPFAPEAVAIDLIYVFPREL
jgi:hypothetical protein